MVSVCGACHADTVKRQDNSPAKHPPIKQGECTKCHDPHSSDIPLMFVTSSEVELCGKCHDWQRHSSHPIGEKFRDPRNGNLNVACLSCHRAHGTEYRTMFPYAELTGLCVKCHEKFKR
jgi:predicted CXXCH cytochrome family protein